MTDQFHRILMRVQKPARYVGGEYNQIIKDKKDVDVRVAFCFPDTYEIGMSNIGMRILYGVMNEMPGVWCERVFAPWGDMEDEMRAHGIPLWTLESHDAVSDFDMIAFTLGYEMCYSNVLNRNFKAEKPMQKIVTDVTYIKHNGKWYYLAGYLDLFNNEIVEWELSDTFDNFLVMKPAERLLKRKMSTEHQVLLHSDQGVQYSSAGYCNLLKEYNVIQSMSRAGNPHDNAVMESFWGRFKDTLRKHFRYWECDDLRSTIEQAIYYFNNERPVRKLKGKPPVLYRTELVA